MHTLKCKIRIGINSYDLKNGGRARVTSKLLYYLEQIKIFELYLFTVFEKDDEEYYIPKNIKRIIIKNNLIENIIKYKINIFIYQLSDIKEMIALNELKNIKVIFYQHSCFLNWIYRNQFYYFKPLYKIYQSFKYIVNLIPFENDFLFLKWGIRSILMNNFNSYDYNSVTPSDLSSKTILMIGRANDIFKRFDLGIKAMKYIIKEISDCNMIIISKIIKNDFLHKLKNSLNLDKNVQFVEYTKNPENYFKNISLHFFPTLCEASPMVLSETKIYGIPSILLGLDYVSLAKGGTIIIYNDSPKSLAKVAIEILKNKQYRKKLGNEARQSMLKFTNEIISQKWVKLILSVFNGEYYYQKLRNEDKKISMKEAINILSNQIKLFHKRNHKFKEININNLQNYTFILNLK